MWKRALQIKHSQIQSILSTNFILVGGNTRNTKLMEVVGEVEVCEVSTSKKTSPDPISYTIPNYHYYRNTLWSKHFRGYCWYGILNYWIWRSKIHAVGLLKIKMILNLGSTLSQENGPFNWHQQSQIRIFPWFSLIFKRSTLLCI